MYKKRMHIMKYLLPLVLIATPVLAEDAQPQNMSRCADAQKIHNFLVNEYGEKPFAEMKNSQGGQIIMYVNPKTSSYTVIQTDMKVSCGVSAGTDFKPATEKHWKDPEPNDKKPETPM